MLFLRLALAVLALLLIFPQVAWAACTGSSPNLSAPDTGNAVTNGTNFAACLTAAVLGDTISLTAGAEYRGAFILGNKGAGTSFITIRPASLAGLPSGTRVSPGQASLMAKITTSTSDPTFTMLADAHHWKLIGLELTTTGDPYANGQSVGGLLNSVNDGSITYSHWPHDITVDRCLMHPFETSPSNFRALVRAVVFDGANMTLSNSYIYDFMGWGTPTTIATVTAATNASPVQITTSTTNADPGRKDLLSFSGGTGAWAGLNGTKVATWVDSTHYTLQNYDPTTFALSNVDATGFGTFAGQTVNQLLESLNQTNNVLIQQGPGPITITNNFLEAMYSQIFTGGSTTTWVDPANVTTVTAVTDRTHVTLASVTNLAVGDMIAFKHVDDQTVSDAVTRPGFPAQTLLTVQQHSFPAGTVLYRQGWIAVSGFTGAWSALNANFFLATVVDSTHIAVTLDSTGFTPPATGSGMKWIPVVTPPAGSDFTDTRWHVGHVTNISGLNITYEWWGHQPENIDGSGAGILVTNGSAVQYRGRVIDGITVTKNTISKPRAWTYLFRNIANIYRTDVNHMASGQKAYWESKQGTNVLIEGNIFDVSGGYFASDDLGTVCFALNQANQQGSTPWVRNSDWTIRNNIFRGLTYHKLQMVEEFMTGSTGTNLTITNNLFGPPAPSSWIELGGLPGVTTVTHNTARNVGTGTNEYHGYVAIVGQATNVTIRDNIGNWAANGYLDISGGAPFVPTARDHEYLIDSGSVGFTPPTGDFRVATDAAMGFVNVTSADAGGDYHGYALTGGSVGHNAASDGKDVGVNFSLLDAALSTGPVVIQGPTNLSGKVTIQ